MGKHGNVPLTLSDAKNLEDHFKSTIQKNLQFQCFKAHFKSQNLPTNLSIELSHIRIYQDWFVGWVLVFVGAMGSRFRVFFL